MKGFFNALNNWEYFCSVEEIYGYPKKSIKYLSKT